MNWALKWLVLSIALLIALGLLIRAALSAYDYVTHDRHVANITVRAINSATVSEADASLVDRCNDEFPIAIGFVNGSTRTVERVSIHIEARLPNRSTNILPWSTSVTSDYILPPGEGVITCRSFGALTEFLNAQGLPEAEYTATIESVTSAERPN